MMNDSSKRHSQFSSLFFILSKASVTRTFNKLTSVFHFVCPVIDREFRHNIVKIDVDPRGDSRVDLQTNQCQIVFSLDIKNSLDDKN